MPRLPRPARRVALGLLVALVAGCADEPVRWTRTSAPVAPAGDSTLALTAAGDVVPDSMALLAAHVAPPAGTRCAGSLRLARAGRLLHAVWWTARPDSTALLLAARSADGGRSWTAPVPVDSLDRGVSGCRRAPAAVAADSASGYVHVTYGLVAPEGAGLFFAHSMDGGASFHSPVPITYGERLGRTSVAASGDLVAVGFEDPNSTTPRIGLALSRTMGHIFEHRLLPVSDENGAATRPMTAVSGHRLAIGWEQRAAAGAPTAAALVVRAGVVP